jgi:anaerobic selenocysteine-containing dehydrogenase
VTNRATLHSACPLDCPDACSLAVTVEDGRVVKLDGDHRNPSTRGFICAKVRRFHERLYGPDRLLHPGVRDGAKGEGRFRRVSWDEAFDRIAGKIEEVRGRHGAEAILPFAYGGSNGVLTQDAVDARFFYRLGASRLGRTVCAATSGRACTALYGGMPGVGYTDYVHARLIVLWGANPSISGIHLVPQVLEARRLGAKLVVVDPRRTPLAKQADLHLAVRPGTDLPVALAVIRRLFEEGGADFDFLERHAAEWQELRRRAAPWTPERAAEAAGVPAERIAEFARLYAETSPAVVRCGWGVERNRNGGSAVAAVLALPAVGGKFGVRGGGFTLSTSETWSLDTSIAVGEEPPPVRTLNMNRLGRMLTEGVEPPIALLFVYNANPVATLPNQELVRRGLAREDLFTVVLDPVLTDTARYADVALPGTTFLEHDELRAGYGAVVLQRGRPVVPPVGEARSNHAVFLELCHRLGLARPWDADRPGDFVIAAVAGMDGAEKILAGLDRDRIVVPDPTPVPMVDRLPGTADGRIHLCPEDLDREAPAGLYGFRPPEEDCRHPLSLLSPAGPRAICSTLGELDSGPPVLEIHPDDARRHGVGAGDPIRVHNSWGEVRAVARLSPDLRPGTVLMEKGMWLRNAPGGGTVNALIPDDLSDLAGGACFSDAKVTVERIA